MALRWLLHSACHVLGYPIEDYPYGELKNLKGLSQKQCSTKKFNEIGYSSSGFQMPLHYPRYTKPDYESMEEWKVDLLLKQYGLTFKGNLDEKRAFAMGAFLWPDQY